MKIWWLPHFISAELWSFTNNDHLKRQLMDYFLSMFYSSNHHFSTKPLELSLVLDFLSFFLLVQVACSLYFHTFPIVSSNLLMTYFEWHPLPSTYQLLFVHSISSFLAVPLFSFVLSESRRRSQSLWPGNSVLSAALPLPTEALS